MILLVEDNDDIKDVVEASLEDQGLTVRSVNDGGRALQIAENSQFDCFILDLKLPGMHGMSVAEKLREIKRYKKTPIVIFSGSVDQDAISRMKKVIVSAVHVKPFNPEKVARSVASILEDRKQMA